MGSALNGIPLPTDHNRRNGSISLHDSLPWSPPLESWSCQEGPEKKPKYMGNNDNTKKTEDIKNDSHHGIPSAFHVQIQAQTKRPRSGIRRVGSRMPFRLLDQISPFHIPVHGPWSMVHGPCDGPCRRGCEAPERMTCVPSMCRECISVGRLGIPEYPESSQSCRVVSCRESKCVKPSTSTSTSMSTSTSTSTSTSISRHDAQAAPHGQAGNAWLCCLLWS